jgi:hypothetical protein
MTVTARDADNNIATGYTGKVQFTSDIATATLPADYTFTQSDAGSHEFSATAPANVGSWTLTVKDSTSPQLTDSVTIDVQGQTVTTLLSDGPNSSIAGEPVTFTASISSQAGGRITGTVTFLAGTSKIGTAPVSGSVAKLTTSSLPVGDHSITAEYAGGGGFLPSASQSIPHNVRTSHFAAPQGFIATATGPGAVSVSWMPVDSADRYELFRRGSNGTWGLAASTRLTSVVDTSVTAGNAYLYYARAISTTGAVSADSAIEVATTIMFVDDPLAALTVVKAAHVEQLRAAVNALRATAGVLPASFTDSSLAGKPLRAAHVLELRDALATARTAAGLPAAAFSAPAPASGTVVRAVHFQELRNAVK